MIPFVGETVCRAFNFVFIPVFLLLLKNYFDINLGNLFIPWIEEWSAYG